MSATLTVGLACRAMSMHSCRERRSVPAVGAAGAAAAGAVAHCDAVSAGTAAVASPAAVTTAHSVSAWIVCLIAILFSYVLSDVVSKGIVFV